MKQLLEDKPFRFAVAGFAVAGILPEIVTDEPHEIEEFFEAVRQTVENA